MALTQISTQGIKDGTITGTDLATNVDLVDNQKLRLGTGNDLQIYHDGSNSYIEDAGTGSLYIKSSAQLYLQSYGGETFLKADANGAVELYYDGTKKLDTQSTSVRLFDDLVMSANNIQLNDNAQIQIGNAPDMRIYHDGSHSYITNSTGDLTLVDESRIKLRTNQFVLNNHANDESIIYAAADGEVSLYHNGTKRFDTTSTGATVTGNLNATNDVIITGSGEFYGFDNSKLVLGHGRDLQIYHDSANSLIDEVGTGILGLRSDTGINLYKLTGNEFMLKAIPDGAVELYYDNSKKFETTSYGAKWTGILLGADNQQLQLGSSGDLQIYHDGTNSYIDNANTGILRIRGGAGGSGRDIQIQAKNGEYSINAIPDGAVELYHNNVKQFETITTGFKSIASGNRRIAIGSTNASGAMLVLDGDSDGDGSGNDYAFIDHNSSGKLRLFNYADAVELHHAGNKKFETTSYGVSLTGTLLASGNIKTVDNGIIAAGNSDDLQIYHDGTNSFIKDTAGASFNILATESIAIKTNNTEFAIACNKNGSVELYHNNTRTFETTAFGAQAVFSAGSGTTPIFKVLHGNLTQGVGIGYHAIAATGTNTDVDLFLQSKGSSDITLQSSAGEEMAVFTPNGAAKLYHNNVHTFSTTDYGASVSFNSPGGTTPILKVLHANQTQGVGIGYAGVVSTGSNANVILNIRSKGTSNVDISTSTDESMAKFIPNGAVELYYDGNKKLETTSKGIKVEGGQANGELGVFHATGSTFQSCTLQSVASRNTTNHTYLHFKCSINGIADKMHVRDSGDVRNTNNSYGSISDISLKENIVDAGSQWNDIKNIKVRKFNFKSLTDPDQKTMLGVVAQEAELVCPNLVDTEVSLQEGVEKEYKSFKYSVLYMKAIKCLQEAMAKIEVLETEVAALKAA